MRFWIACGLAVLFFAAEMHFIALFDAVIPMPPFDDAKHVYAVDGLLCWGLFVACSLWAVVEGIVWVVRHGRKPALAPTGQRG